MKSLPLQGEWIEIKDAVVKLTKAGSLPLQGEWIEIRNTVLTERNDERLSLCRESGLK